MLSDPFTKVSMRRLHLALLLSLCFCLLRCGVTDPQSQLSSSREARVVLGAARGFPLSLLETIDGDRLGSDWIYQRQSFWSLWSYLFEKQSIGNSLPPLENWQTWYSGEDIKRLFQYLYEGLGKEGRLQRAPFAPAAIDQAFRWHDSEQFLDPAWDQTSFQRWLASYEGPLMERAIPGLNKMLINREAGHFILSHYALLFTCLRDVSARSNCMALRWPKGAALLKTAWRRSGQGVAFQSFATDAASLDRQLKAPQWLPQENWQPPAGTSYALQTPSGQTFHLTGMHLMLKLEDDWLWSSIWLGPLAAQDLAVDHGEGLASYRLCSVSSFASPLDIKRDDEAKWPLPLQESAAILRQNQIANWCSNPYLEVGKNNQKTNCIACHQYAGLPWSRDEITRRLHFDLPSMQKPSSELGPADFVWSLLNGPDALALIIADTIDYFDAYDPY